MSKRKICFVTGSRADYGYLLQPMRHIRDSSEFELQLIVTGPHLSSNDGESISLMRRDGFVPDMFVDCVLASDTPVATGKSIAVGLAGMCDAFSLLKPDLVLILGDRFEIFAVAQAAYVLGLPIAHLGGGDVTEGALDEGFRHSITKLSHFHFPTNVRSARRIINMGEDPSTVHIIGSTSLDLLQEFQPASREAITSRTGYMWHENNIIVTFHPATIDRMTPMAQVYALVEGLELLPPSIGILVTGTNSDPGAHEVSHVLRSFAGRNPHRCTYCAHLGQYLYFSVLSLMDAVVGNSSSGLYEAPSFQTPTVNIGPRQDGRCRARSVIDCPTESRQIADAIHRSLSLDCRDVQNPYGDGHATDKLVRVLRENINWSEAVQKRFYESVN